MPLDLIDDPHFERHETFASWVQALEAKPAATNVAALVGHSTLRAAAMADLDRVATPGGDREDAGAPRRGARRRRDRPLDRPPSIRPR
jgi:N-acyl-D-amino-acid deacylase